MGKRFWSVLTGVAAVAALASFALPEETRSARNWVSNTVSDVINSENSGAP